MNYLVHAPALRSECSAYLREAYAAGQKQPGATTSDYLDEVTTLAKLDETFAANLIHETNWLCHGVAWQGQESRQPSNQEHHGFLIYAWASLRFNDKCLRKVVLTRAFTHRGLEVGSRWNLLSGGFINAAGVVNWLLFV